VGAERWRNFGIAAEVALQTREAAATAGVNKIWKWLRTSGALMKVRSFSAEGIGCDHGSGLELFVTDRADHLDGA
jgi:hypothetical protein